MNMTKPNILVFSGYGFNCEEETKFAFELAGGVADIVHINDLIAKPSLLKKYQILAFPGGFAYGDDTGSGNAYANKLKNHLWSELKTFLEKDHLVIGICNGFQIITNLGLLPALHMKYGQRQVALLHNESARYTVRWVDVKVANDSPWLSNITMFPVAIAHGEGRLFTDTKTLSELQTK
jgi:phosphoribosylformylglycinamidine synthase